MREKSWKAIIAFADDSEVSEDWNYAYSKVVKVFKDTEVKVYYAPAGTDSIQVAPQEIISIALFREVNSMGFIAIEAGREPIFLGDHGGFYDPETSDPIQEAKSILEGRLIHYSPASPPASCSAGDVVSDWGITPTLS